MAEIYDPEAEATSIMMQQPSLCDGQSTGRACEHYWRYTQKVESANADYLKSGMTGRVCIVTPAYPIEMFSEEKRVACNFYKSRKLPLLKRIGVALKVIQDPHAYDASEEEYNPLTPEEVKQIHSQRSTPISDLVPASASDFANATAGFSDQAVEDLKAEVGEMSEAEIKAAMGYDKDDDGGEWEDVGADDPRREWRAEEDHERDWADYPEPWPFPQVLHLEGPDSLNHSVSAHRLLTFLKDRVGSERTYVVAVDCAKGNRSQFVYSCASTGAKIAQENISTEEGLKKSILPDLIELWETGVVSIIRTFDFELLSYFDKKGLKLWALGDRKLAWPKGTEIPEEGKTSHDENESGSLDHKEGTALGKEED